MCKIEKVVFLCKIDGKFAMTDVVALTTVRITLKYVYKEYILSTNTSLHLVKKKKHFIWDWELLIN